MFFFFFLPYPFIIYDSPSGIDLLYYIYYITRKYLLHTYKRIIGPIISYLYKMRSWHRNKLSHIWSTDFQQGCQDHSVEKGQFFQQIVLGKLDSHMQKNEAGPLAYIIYKNWLKMMKTITVTHIWNNIKILKNNLKWIKVLNVRAKTIKLLKENLLRWKASWH